MSGVAAAAPGNGRVNEERIAHIKDRPFIHYPRFAKYLGKMERMLVANDENRKNILIAGVSGNGKSSIGKYFLEANLPISQPDSDADFAPIVYVSLPEDANVGSFAGRILENLWESRKANVNHSERMHIARSMLKALGTKILIIDEFQQLNTGTRRNREALQNTVKEIGEYCNLSVVGIGMPPAVDIILSEPQLNRRFEPLALPQWTFNDESRSLLGAMEDHFELQKKSFLAENDTLARRILLQTDGTLCWIMEFLEMAAIEAINSGKEKIDLKLIDSLDWIRPSKRAAHASRELGIQADEA
ncbi:TniB family NTP-binding protein [Sphingorhabdus sp. EL138]|uniref:TniB family NTP-binding protein n=1 Tax=Sphingorhabdus sp. EL138 TaxID=2073156 RepID=UPI000D68FC0D|nr:TniB family NTP-binding protein [Sphingorhabdus sp. EL138]